MCDKLRELTKCLTEMPSFYSIKTKLNEEQELLKKAFCSKFKLEKILNSEFQGFIDSQKSLSLDLNSVLLYRKSFNEKVEKVIRNLNEKFKLEQEEKCKFLSLSENLKVRIKDLEKYNEVLLAENEHLRKNNKKVNVGEGSEEVCKNCKKIFNTVENFRWSCKTHLSNFNGSAFWCCGKTDRNDLGCMVSQHFPEDLEIDETLEKSQFCSNCKDLGHLCQDCPKDPNTRSKFDPLDEFKRISDLHNNQIIKKTSPLKGFHLDYIEKFSDFSEIDRLKIVSNINSPLNH